MIQDINDGFKKKTLKNITQKLCEYRQSLTKIRKQFRKRVCFPRLVFF